MFFLPFEFLNKGIICVSQNKGVMYKIGSVWIWCRPDSPDTQIRNSCSTTQLPSSLWALLYVWCMPGSWGVVHAQVLPPSGIQLWVSAMTCSQTREPTGILQCRDSQRAAAWSLRVVSWFSSSDTQRVKMQVPVGKLVLKSSWMQCLPHLFVLSLKAY